MLLQKINVNAWKPKNSLIFIMILIVADSYESATFDEFITTFVIVNVARYKAVQISQDF